MPGSSSIETLEEVGIDFDELQEEIQYEIKRWFECVDFEFVIERLEDREIIPQDALDKRSVYDEVYEMIEEEVGKVFFKK